MMEEKNLLILYVIHRLNKLNQRSSLPYQMLLYCNGWYFGFYLIAEILIFVYKGTFLLYSVKLPHQKVLGFYLSLISLILKDLNFL